MSVIFFVLRTNLQTINHVCKKEVLGWCTKRKLRWSQEKEATINMVNHILLATCYETTTSNKPAYQ
jgi:hypothetical protein